MTAWLSRLFRSSVKTPKADSHRKYTSLSAAKDVLRAILLMLLLSQYGLRAQEVYTELKAAKDIQTFTEVSNGLVCQCGCNFVLSFCPHIECPWGIPARRFIEDRIRANYSTTEILQGFENGFGHSLHKEAYARQISLEGHQGFINMLAKGYGPQISANSSLLTPAILIVFTICLGSLLILYWYRRNRSVNTESHPEDTQK